ncbi:MAG: tRNA (uridine(34)/cytosine(34)/5-carboxymethylaminomethyluridine(34)-2'-O)-methyltransferase TrmL [Actinophytocola sp.]|nr:tRNA (uridine(34)/cytosine(34)/5-carboxymethylaminomethyluridine(34)-2'-O)-methyltransferase TrmL [Actinophytocola sp.]
MFRIAFYQPEIPPNTGNAIRLAANTGCELHLIEPLGFSLAAKQLRRAGLDYHELTTTHVHPDLDTARTAFGHAAIYAFATTAARCYADIAYQPGDVLLFGPESVGLPAEVTGSDAITDRVSLPMAPGSRSLNLANSASIVVYEAWRQHGFTGAADR